MKKTGIFTSIFLLIYIIGNFSSIFAEGSKSKYSGDIKACLDAREPNGKGAKSITDYVCPVGVVSLKQDIVFQVIMSREFKKLDDEVKKDLQKIYDGSNKDIGQLATNIRDLFDSTVEPRAKYPDKYAEVCSMTTIKEASDYFVSKKSNLVTDHIVEWKEKCNTLVKNKLWAYKQSAWLLGNSAVVKSFLNDKHTYMRKLKDQYEKFLTKWTTYVGQLGVIKDKWPTKTKNIQ